jgi:hypothetical protein
LPVETVVVHPTRYAVAVTAGKVDCIKGPVYRQTQDHHRRRATISTPGSAWENCSGLDNPESLLAGVTTSGYYVRTGKAPRAGLGRSDAQWPNEW